MFFLCVNKKCIHIIRNDNFFHIDIEFDLQCFWLENWEFLFPNMQKELNL